MIITVIGNGFVGKATGLLENPETTVWFYDIVPDLCKPVGLHFSRINAESDMVFICVPTPMNVDGSCSTSIIEAVLSQLDHPCVVLRSTVPVGYADSKNCFFMPEFLTEKNWPRDFYQCGMWVFGMPSGIEESRALHFNNLITRLMDSAFRHDKISSKEIFSCENREAELIKLVRNNYLSTRVVFFNHIFDLCQKMGISYEKVRHGISGDKRIGSSHTMVDGTEYRGYGGTCFPKDTNSLFHIFQEEDVAAPLLEANLRANEYLLQPDKPWLNMYNRAITNNTGHILAHVATPSSASATLLTTLQEKEDLYIINMDNMDNTHTSLQEHPRYYFRKIHPSQSIFLPRCDAMTCHISSSNHTSLESMRMLLSAHDFSTQYSIPLTTHTDREEEENSCIIPLMKQLFPQHQHTDTQTS